MVSLTWWWVAGRLGLLRRGRLGLLLFFFDACSTSTLSPGNSTGNGITGAIALRRVLERLGHLDQRAERPVDVHIQPQRELAEGCGRGPQQSAGLAERHLSIVSRVANSPARSPSRRMIIDWKRMSLSRSKAISAISPFGLGGRYMSEPPPGRRESSRPPTIRPPFSSKIIGSTPSKVPVISIPWKPRLSTKCLASKP